MKRTISQQFAALLKVFGGFTVWISLPSNNTQSNGIRVMVYGADDDSFIGAIGETGISGVHEFRFDSIDYWRITFLPPIELKKNEKSLISVEDLIKEVPILEYYKNLINFNVKEMQDA